MKWGLARLIFIPPAFGTFKSFYKTYCIEVKTLLSFLFVFGSCIKAIYIVGKDCHGCDVVDSCLRLLYSRQN